MARLHLDSLKHKTNLGDLRKTVEQFPQGLDELYADTGTRVMNQNPEWRTLACQTLGWLSSAFRQLKIEELRHALTVRSGDTVLDSERLPAVDILCESCHGLVTIDEESRIVRLVHRTAQDFFDRHRAQYFSDIHTQITRTCLDYLMFDVFAQGPCGFISSRPMDMWAARGDISESRLLSTRFLQNPFLDYAAIHWGLHACGEPERKLENSILRFLQASTTLDSFFQVHYSELFFGRIQYASDRLLNTSGSLPLHVAVSFGLEHIVHVLLGILSASDINGLDQRGKTALHWAVQNGSESLALLLLRAGARIDTQVKVQSPTLNEVSPSGCFQILKFYLSLRRLRHIERVAVPNEEIKVSAVRFNMKKVIELHISSAATATEKKNRANGVLWEASTLGNTGMIDVALANGAQIEAKEGMDVSALLDVKIEDFRILQTARIEKGQTSLLMAVENGRLDATLALLSRGALISATDRFGKNALQTAITSTKVVDERLSLVYHGTPGPWFYAFAGVPDNGTLLQLSRSEQQYRTQVSRVTALEVSSQLGRVASLELDPSSADLQEPFRDFLDALNEDDDQGVIVNQLLDLGADIAIKTHQGQTGLRLAIGSATRLQLLLERGAGVLEIDSCDETGRTALHYAAAAGNPMALHLLLKYGADVSASDPMGATALHLGILSPGSIEFALQQGVSANATDRLGRTPMHYHFMLQKRSEHEHKGFRTPMRNEMMKNWHVGEDVVRLLEKAGARDLQDTQGLRPKD